MVQRLLPGDRAELNGRCTTGGSRCRVGRCGSSIAIPAPCKETRLLASLCQIWRKTFSLGLLAGLILLSALNPSLERVRGADPGAAPTLYTVCDLKRMTPCELELLFASAGPGQMPSGWTPGELLVLTDFPMPRVSEALARRYWRGKEIEPDGSFINQFRYR